MKMSREEIKARMAASNEAAKKMKAEMVVKGTTKANLPRQEIDFAEPVYEGGALVGHFCRSFNNEGKKIRVFIPCK